MTKATEFRNLGVEELYDKLSDLKKQLMKYRFEAKTGKLEEQSVIARVRKDVARVWTVINESRAGEPSEVKAAAPKAAGKAGKKAPVKAAAVKATKEAPAKTKKEKAEAKK